MKVDWVKVLTLALVGFGLFVLVRACSMLSHLGPS